MSTVNWCGARRLLESILTSSEVYPGTQAPTSGSPAASRGRHSSATEALVPVTHLRVRLAGHPSPQSVATRWIISSTVTVVRTLLGAQRRDPFPSPPSSLFSLPTTPQQPIGQTLPHTRSRRQLTASCEKQLLYYHPSSTYRSDRILLFHCFHFHIPQIGPSFPIPPTSPSSPVELPNSSVATRTNSVSQYYAILIHYGTTIVTSDTRIRVTRRPLHPPLHHEVCLPCLPYASGILPRRAPTEVR